MLNENKGKYVNVLVCVFIVPRGGTLKTVYSSWSFPKAALRVKKERL